MLCVGKELNCVENQTWILHLGNVPVYASLLIRSCMIKHQTSVVPHPPYSPDLDPAHFFLFSKLRTTLKGRRFQNIGEIKENELKELSAITESAFQETFQQWKKRWKQCIASRRDYLVCLQCLQCCKISNKIFIEKVPSFGTSLVFINSVRNICCYPVKFSKL